MAENKEAAEPHRKIAGHLVCAMLLIGPLVWGAVLMKRPEMPFPFDPLTAVLVYVCAIPTGIAIGSAIHPISYIWLIYISVVRWVMVVWACLQVSGGWRGVYGMKVGASDYLEAIVIASVITVPLLLIEYGWLSLMKRLFRKRAA